MSVRRQGAWRWVADGVGGTNGRCCLGLALPVVRLFVALFFFFFFFVVLPLSARRKGVVVGSADRGRRLRAGWVRPWPWRVDWKTIAGLTSRQRGPSRPPAERPFHCSQRIGNMVWLVFFFSLSRPGMGGVVTSPVAPVVILTAHGLVLVLMQAAGGHSVPPAASAHLPPSGSLHAVMPSPNPRCASRSSEASPLGDLRRPPRPSRSPASGDGPRWQRAPGPTLCRSVLAELFRCVRRRRQTLLPSRPARASFF